MTSINIIKCLSCQLFLIISSTTPSETTTRAYSRVTTRTSYDNRRNEINQSSDKKYFKPKKSSYYDPFSFQSTERSPTVEKYLKYKNSQKNKNIYSNRLDSRFSIQVDNKTLLLISQHFECPGIKLCQLLPWQAETSEHPETRGHLI